MKSEYRSACPISSALDIIGDKWSLLLVRDMLTAKKKTFKEFAGSSEGIAPGILSSRLKWLERNGLLTKRKLAKNRKENVYLLTEKGLDLAAVVCELLQWSLRNLKSEHPAMPTLEDLGLDLQVPNSAIAIQDGYRAFVAEILG